MSSAHLRGLREMVGFSAREAAEFCGVPFRTWQEWESGRGGKGKRQRVAQEQLLMRIGDIAGYTNGILEDLHFREEGEVPELIHLYRYRTTEELETVHPDFEGGLPAHDAQTMYLAFALAMEGWRFNFLWGPGETTHRIE